MPVPNGSRKSILPFALSSAPACFSPSAEASAIVPLNKRHPFYVTSPPCQIYLSTGLFPCHPSRAPCQRPLPNSARCGIEPLPVGSEFSDSRNLRAGPPRPGSVFFASSSSFAKAPVCHSRPAALVGHTSISITLVFSRRAINTMPNPYFCVSRRYQPLPNTIYWLPSRIHFFFSSIFPEFLSHFFSLFRRGAIRVPAGGNKPKLVPTMNEQAAKNEFACQHCPKARAQAFPDASWHRIIC